jgi:hypothetical protein
MAQRGNRKPKRPKALPQPQAAPTEESTRFHPYGALGGTIEHRDVIERSALCGCRLCRHLFSADEIEEWIDETDGIGLTAMCPNCGLDGVVGSASLFPDDLKFLRELACRWGVRFPAQAGHVEDGKD